MAREDVEIAADRGDVDGEAGDRLAAVEQQLGADLVGEIGGAARVEHRAEDVGDMGERDELVALGEHRGHRVEIDTAIHRQRDDVDCGTDALGDELPGDDVRMVFERRQQDAVASLEVSAGPALCDEVDPLGRAADEHHFVGRGGAQEGGDALAGGLVGERHVGGALIDAAMDGRVGLAIGAGDRVDDGARLLRGGGGVEIGPAFGNRREIGDQVQGLPSRLREGAGEGLFQADLSHVTCPPLTPPASGRGIEAPPPASDRRRR